MVMRALTLAASVLVCAIGVCQGYGLQPMFSPVWRGLLDGPCQYRGYSFLEDEAAIRQMAANGANIGTSGHIWIPTEDPAAPDGNGTDAEGWQQGGPVVEQELRAVASFSAVRVCLAGYGAPLKSVRITLLGPPQPDGNRRSVASAVLRDVPDNAWAELALPQPADPGFYLLRLSDAEGPAAVWCTRLDAAGELAMFVSGRAVYNAQVPIQLRPAGGDWPAPPAESPRRLALLLGERLSDVLTETGMKQGVQVGDWNNGLFPYYPDWWYRKYPDFTMCDQDGRPFAATMFGEAPRGWPVIDHPAEMAGVRRFAQSLVAGMRDDPSVAFWILGGEALYPTYCFPDRLSDYSAPAEAHFRAWLAERYGDIARLNAAWKMDYRQFASVPLPRKPGETPAWRDFLEFRFRAMAERFAWHYQSVLSTDDSRPILTCNHGNIFTGKAAADMGMQPEDYAGVADGFECGQIVEGTDPDYYNLMWAQALASLGRPVAPLRLACKLPDPKARGGGRSYTPETARRYGYETLGSGAWVLGYIQWQGSLPDGEWGVKGTPAEAATRQILGELGRLQPYLKDMWPVPARVGWYVSRTQWSMRGFNPLWTTVHVDAVRANLPLRWVYDSSDLSGLDTVICAGNALISPAARAKLEAWVRAGGTLMLVGENGVADENFRKTPALFADAKFLPHADVLPPARVGQGWVLKMNETVPAGKAVAIAVERAGRGGARPVVLKCAGTVDVKREVNTAEPGVRTPMDLSAQPRIVQPFTATEGETVGVSFVTPTYSSSPPGMPLRVSVHTGGPDGPMAGEGMVPADELADNSPHTLRIAKPVKAGQRACVVFHRPEGLGPQKLGLWGMVSGQDGKPHVDLRLLQRDRMPKVSRVLSFALTDGTNVLVVLQSLLPDACTLGVEPAAWMLDAAAPGPGVQWQSRNLLTGDDARPMKAGQFRLSLAAYGTAVVLLSPKLPAGGEMAALPARLAPDMELPEEARLRQALADSSLPPEKALALRRRLAALPGMRVRASASADEVSLSADIMDRSGDPVTGAKLKARIIPAFGFCRDLKETSPGHYSVRFARREMPRMFQYPTQCYAPFTGAVSVEIEAVLADGTDAGRRLVLQLP